jgi:hypothetical protein
MSSHSAELHTWRFLADERWISAAILQVLALLAVPVALILVGGQGARNSS